SNVTLAGNMVLTGTISGNGVATLNVPAGNTATLTGAITGALALNKVGTGTLVVAPTPGSSNAYTGVTNILAGTVVSVPNGANSQVLGNNTGATLVASGANLQMQQRNFVTAGTNVSTAEPLVLAG